MNLVVILIFENIKIILKGKDQVNQRHIQPDQIINKANRVDLATTHIHLTFYQNPNSLLKSDQFTGPALVLHAYLNKD